MEEQRRWLGGDFPLRPSQRVRPAHTQTFDLQNWEGIGLCCFKPPRLWSFVWAAPGHRSNTLQPVRSWTEMNLNLWLV